MARHPAHARRAEIVRLATTSGLASVEELSASLGVTASTIRRDLAKLTSQGKLARTYGGAISLGHHPEASLRQRLGEAYAAKHAIARWAAAQVQPGETILLDAGSTTGALAEELCSVAGLSELTVVTAGITAMARLAEADFDVIALGGRLRPLSQAFVGPLTESAVQRVSFDRAFMGADAVHAERGICEAALEQTRLKELMMSRAEHTYVLAHAEKLGQSPFHAWAVMPARWTLVTDESADPEELDRFRGNGVEVVVAPAVS
ncbi:MAG TPA: DeoR/GlpR family DNA-binding transcription regulator [Intrasporangium sp.]|uniref:DeoR/GlpR family DNA-binding transcription regulator n=1 Tax=Intrasporangium sp. TaxID=1925024 RepID=UPI002D77AEA2|nr:DeoR/GlpR family DNA-binding transcription regulator [Intrasporangium sp.]HET7397854.1 DeoR/GlpR family DNA-binding transcription regulator [Intrasporangium sp.]